MLKFPKYIFQFLYLHFMKKRVLILNSFLVFAVLFSILFQSVHSYEHIAAQLSEKKCHHKVVSSKEITHQHHKFDTCFVCDFTLSSVVSANVAHFEFKKISFPAVCFVFKSREIIHFFTGSLFALRAPPICIV